MGKKIGTLLLLLITAVLIGGAYNYINYRTKNALSDAAFIKSDRLALLSTKVGGKVEEIYVDANQKVKKGALLAQIDPTDLKLKQEELRHKLAALDIKAEALREKKERIARTLELKSQIAKSDITSAKEQKKALNYQIEALQAKLAKLQSDKKRFEKMYKKHLVSKSDLEGIQSQSKSLEKEIAAMRQKLLILDSSLQKAKLAYRLAQTQKRQIGELQKSIEALIQQKNSLAKVLESVAKQLEYTKLYAPFDARVAKIFFDPPKIIKAGSPIVALVDTTKLYCEVLLSEKKLKGVKVGNKVAIFVDALDGKEYRGKVASIAPTSASTFSLVPRDIASGEFTKLDQRFVVRIALDDTSDLRAGMGATVAIERR